MDLNIGQLITIVFVIAGLGIAIYLNVRGNYLIISQSRIEDGFKLFESSVTEGNCVRFSEAFFMEDIFKEKFYNDPNTAGFFRTWDKNDDFKTVYRKTKLFCAEFLSIRDAVMTKGNLEASIHEINSIYKEVYPTFYTDYDEMAEAISEIPVEDKQVWLMEVSRLIIEDIEHVNW